MIDGDRHASFSLEDSSRLALVAGDERLSETPALVLEVPNVSAALEVIVNAGGTVLRRTHVGPHELRAVAADPSGNPLVITQKP